MKVNERIKELLEAKDREIDFHVVYGKKKLQQAEYDWLKSMTFVRMSFRKNLHAKCYLNEKQALLTSMNLYEFSQQNNNEMGILVSQEEDSDLYKISMRRPTHYRNSEIRIQVWQERTKRRRRLNRKREGLP